MSNMSYCRFENTERDLNDCYIHINDGGLSKSEKEARQRLIDTCNSILQEAEELEDEEEN